MAGSTETLTVCEPGRLEEDVMMGKMVIGVNAYREVCTLHLAGQVKFLLWVGLGMGLNLKFSLYSLDLKF